MGFYILYNGPDVKHAPALCKMSGFQPYSVIRKWIMILHATSSVKARLRVQSRNNLRYIEQ